MANYTFGKVGLWLAGGAGAYAILIGLLLTPPLQRLYSSFLVLHKGKHANTI